MTVRWMALALGVFGCSNTVSGSVDGSAASNVRTAVFDEVTVDLPFLDDLTAFRLVLTDMPDACATLEEVFEATSAGGDCSESCANLTAVATERLGAPSYWGLTLDATADAGVVQTYSFDSSFDALDAFDASFSTWDMSAAYDQAACEDQCRDGNDVIVFADDAAEAGTLTVDAYTALSDISGEFEVDFGAGDQLKGRFEATRCDMSAWVWWL